MSARATAGRVRRRLKRVWKGQQLNREVRRRPRIGITGSFGRGNYGDELYVKTYQHWMRPWADLHMLAGLPRPPYFSEFADNLVDLMDAVVLGGGDLLCPYKPSIDRDFISSTYLRRPLHVAGIGVERNRDDIDPEVLGRWRRFLTNPSVQSVTTRDSGSQQWISQHIRPSIEVGSHPDLVCALPLPEVRRPAGAPILGLVTRHIKSGAEYVQMARVADRLQAEGWRVRHIIGGVGTHGRKDFDNSQRLESPGKETLHTENLDDISRAIGECSLVLSMKLHTTMVATLYGVPTVCVNPVVKARAFMESVDRGDLVIGSRDPGLLDLVQAGVPPVPMDRVRTLRDQAAEAIRALSQRIWDDFRAASAERHRVLASAPGLPAPRYGATGTRDSVAPPPIRTGALAR